MDAWPGYCDEPTALPAEKGKGKAQDKKESPWRYPVVEHGSLAAATLRSKKWGKRYEWMFAAGNAPEYKLVLSSSPIEVFPATRMKALQFHKITPFQRAEQGAHFLRTYYPDVDIPAELIREEIAADERATRTLDNDDIFSGNSVAISSFQFSRKNMAYLAFPMGETGCQLNMSPIVTAGRAKPDLKTSATPVHTFDTPIRQIVASPHTTELGKNKYTPMLGVRTMGSTHFLQVKLAFSRTTYALETPAIITVGRSDIGDRHAVDVALSPQNATGYVASDTGNIFRCGVAEGRNVIEQVHATSETVPIWCRIAACESREKILSIFDRTVTVLDFRTGKSPYELYTVPHSGPRLTSIEDGGEDRIVMLVSTDEILWLDERNTRRPLLAIKHGRDFDTTLHSETRLLTEGPVTFLTSRRSSLITVYDVARGADLTDKHLYMYGDPYALPPIIRPDGPHLGYAFFQQPTLTGSKHLSILQLSQRGSVSLLNLDHVPADTNPGQPTGAPLHAEWSPEVKQLSDAANTRTVRGPLAERAHSIVDLGPLYQGLFVEREEQNLSDQSDVVSDLIEGMPRFWQDTEVPVEHTLTMFDVAMRSGPEPSEASRNDWLTGSRLDSVAGYRAWSQGRIPREQLAQRSPWHFDISSLVRRRVPELEEDPAKTLENLTRYDLADGPDRTADSYRRESEARSQLALDLSLSTDIFAAHQPNKEATKTFDDDMLSISLSTQAMSIAALEPQPVQFEFLRPIRKTHSSSDVEDVEEVDQEVPRKWSNAPAKEMSITPLGVRLLLQEWELGTDPNQYVYHDPYDDPAEAPGPAPRRSGKEPAREPSAGRTAAVPAYTQRPPTIVSSAPHVIAAASQTTVTRKPLAAARSLDTLSAHPNGGSQPTNAWGAPPSSQEIMASTQVLPGPHGARPSAVKKKLPKKRIGGF
ncbi:hypothetical protein C8Q74DRAFT_1313323 [Fomes fomentarius]|nr:hypothetical protein C8Q74DRAFT_1313323 [Fomes fomentarius]